MHWSRSKVPFQKIKNFNKRHKFCFSLESQWQLLSAQITAWVKWKTLYCKPAETSHEIASCCFSFEGRFIAFFNNF